MRIVVALLSIGCASCLLDASIGRDDPESGGGGEGGALTEGVGDTDMGSGTGGGGGEGGAGAGGGEGEGGETRGEEASTGVADTETDMLPALCHPTDDDSECAHCRKTHCCEQIIACHDAPGCFCFWDCVVHAEIEFDACGGHCDYDGLHFEEVIACHEDQCSGICADGHPTDPPPMDVPMD